VKGNAAVIKTLNNSLDSTTIVRESVRGGLNESFVNLNNSRDLSRTPDDAL
jgi:hypothetical protein